ncbi:MAG: hypothetical protein WCQ99_14445 [Pseudomonadota bacterium]
MESIEKIAPGNWIPIGGKTPVDAVVCTIRPGRIEVVFLNEENKALHGEVKWTSRGWDFVGKDAAGKPADKDQRLEPYVKILRAKNK